MEKKRHILQTTSLYAGVMCFIASLVCGAFLYIKVNELGADHPISASFLASMFFFFFVGFLLTIVGKADVPDLRISSIGKTQD